LQPLGQAWQIALLTLKKPSLHCVHMLTLVQLLHPAGHPTQTPLTVKVKGLQDRQLREELQLAQL
jgi:hypothetical protein